MEEEHHFTNIPYNYPLCLNRQCPKASTCLRQLVEQEVPDSAEYWVVISPKYQAKLKGACPHYRSSQKVQYAKGCMNILDNLPHKQRQLAIIHLTEYFSRRTYYRIRKGERVAQHCHAYGTTVPMQWQEVGKALRFRQYGIPAD